MKKKFTSFIIVLVIILTMVPLSFAKEIDKSTKPLTISQKIDREIEKVKREYDKLNEKQKKEFVKKHTMKNGKLASALDMKKLKNLELKATSDKKTGNYIFEDGSSVEVYTELIDREDKNNAIRPLFKENTAKAATIPMTLSTT